MKFFGVGNRCIIRVFNVSILKLITVCLITFGYCEDTNFFLFVIYLDYRPQS